MRTDDDSWDITTSVGATAIGVAVARALETRRSDALFRDPYAEVLVTAVGSPQWTSFMTDGGNSFDDSTRATQSSRGSFMVARTWYFDRYFDQAMQHSIEQVVILASGLDARAYRLPWPSDTVLFELDQPKVLEFKASALADNNVSSAIDVRRVAIDLRQDWPAALRNAGFDRSRPTAWLAEGLLRYLPAPALDRLFDNVTALSAPGSRFATNYNTSTRRQATDVEKSRDSMLRKHGIDIDTDALWYSEEGRTNPSEWFATHGWTVSNDNAADIMARLGRPVPDSAHERSGRHMVLSAELPADVRACLTSSNS